VTTNDSSGDLRRLLASTLEALPSGRRFDALARELARVVGFLDADAAPALQLALASEDDAVPGDPLRGFEHFWTAWPARGGKRLYRSKAEALWMRLSLRDRRAAYRGAVHYAQACAAGTQGAMDAFRWLRDRSWGDWQEAPTGGPTVGRPTAAASIATAADRIRNGQSALFPAAHTIPATSAVAQ
jgi:hypothetical protein